MSTVAERKNCLACGQPLGGLAPQGVCARCLLLTGVEESGAEALTEHEDLPFVPDLPRRFGDYELLEEIARGGMGIVYKARQLSLDRFVAVKMLLLGQYATDEFIHRFRVEASAAASLQHPNIVAIHDVGVHQGQHYFAMDFVDGPNLAQIVRDRPLPPKRAAVYVQAAAEAIQFAHERRILHRDLKPSNILIDSNDQPRITDFGLAKRFGVGAGESSTGSQTAAMSADLTLTGQTLGSPNYIPPEQASVRRGQIGPHSDVYSLGAVLYHALTARPPFRGGTLADTLEQVLTSDPIPPRLLNPEVPADLDTLCLKCLERDIAKRYGTAQEVADELGRYARGEPIVARPVSQVEKVWRWCGRNAALATAGVLILALLLVVAIGSPVVAYQINKARKAEILETQRAQSEALRARQNQYAGDMLAAHLAIEAGEFGRAQQLLGEHVPTSQETDVRGFEWRYLRGLLRGDATRAIPIARTEYRYLSVSPDGRFLANGARVFDRQTGALKGDLGPKSSVLAFTPTGEILLGRGGEEDRTFIRHDFLQGTDTVLLDHETVWTVAFSRSGRWMATGSTKGLRVWDTTTWQVRACVTNAPFESWSSLRSDFSAFNWFSAKGLAFSPDEHLLIAGSGYALSHQADLSAWTVPDLSPLTMSGAVDDASCVAFSPDGQEFATGHWEGEIRFWDPGRLAEIKSRRLPKAHRSWIGEMQYIPGTRRLVTVGSDRCIKIWDAENGESPITLRGHREELTALAVAPDGAIYTVGRGVIKEWSPERLISLEESLVQFPGPCLPAGFCDGGHVLATASDKTLNFWQLNNNGTVTEDRGARVNAAEGVKLRLDWRQVEGESAVSPDRKWLAVGRRREPIRIEDLSGKQPVRLLEGGSAPYQYVGFAPDSQLMIACRTLDSFAVFETGTWKEIALIPTPGKTDTDFPFHFAEKTNLLMVEVQTSVLLWDTRLRRTVREIAGAPGKQPVGSTLSWDGRWVAMGYTDDSFSLHDCASGRLIATVPSHVSGVECLAFSPDGKTLATASGHWVKLWNVVTLREMFSLELPRMAIFVGFLPDGNGLLTADVVGNTQLWRAPDLDRLPPIQ